MAQHSQVILIGIVAGSGHYEKTLCGSFVLLIQIIHYTEKMFPPVMQLTNNYSYLNRL